MDTLMMDRVKSNCKFLLNLNENDNIKASRGELMENDDYVQVDSIVDIEYSIYLTFTDLFLITNNINYSECDKIIKIIDICFDNIYDNKFFQKLMDEEESFDEMIGNIMLEYISLKDRLYYGSPFFNFFSYINNISDGVKQIFKENNEYVSKMMGIYHNQLEGRHYDDSDDSDDDDDDGEECNDDRVGDNPVCDEGSKEEEVNNDEKLD
jgi:hypothetical protein